MYDGGAVMDMVRLENVVKMYDNGKRAVNGVSFTVRKNEKTLIVGASGSGKTTLLKLIIGMEEPSTGSIVVDGMEVHTMDGDTAASFRNRTFGILPRQPGFMKNLTVIQNITLPLMVAKVPVRERKQSVMEYMDALGIKHLAHAYPSRLSGFELQIASLARALAAQPKILLLDGMEADLQVKECVKMESLIHDFVKCGEITIIRFTDRENVDWPCDGRFRLEYGKITEA